MNPLKEKRNQLKLTRNEIAKRLNWAERKLQAYELDDRFPNAKEIYYMCTIGYEMGGEEILKYLEYLNRIRKE